MNVEMIQFKVSREEDRQGPKSSHHKRAPEPWSSRKHQALQLHLLAALSQGSSACSTAAGGCHSRAAAPCVLLSLPSTSASLLPQATTRCQCWGQPRPSAAPVSMTTTTLRGPRRVVQADACATGVGPPLPGSSPEEKGDRGGCCEGWRWGVMYSPRWVASVSPSQAVLAGARGGSFPDHIPEGSAAALSFAAILVRRSGGE